MKLKPIDILNEIRMQRALRPHQSALLLEGRTDCSFFRGIACKTGCRIYATNGKVIARKAAKLALEEGVVGVVAILDLDHDRLLGRELEHENVIYTDENDLEIMAVKSDGFERLLNEYLDYDDRERILASHPHDSISDLLLSHAGVVGVLRYLNTTYTWNLKCRDIEVAEIIEPESNSVSAVLLIRHVFNVTNQANTSLAEAEEIFLKTLEVAKDKKEYAVGHDVTKLLAFFLSKKVWIQADVVVVPYQIEQGLRLCFSDSLFSSTQLISKIKNWEARNNVFRVLRQEFNEN